MANNKKELINWAVEIFNKDLNIVEQRWNLFEQQPYFDYVVNLSVCNKNYEGRGTNKSQKKALNASIGEAIESFVINYNNLKDSNGCALHTDKKIAISHAQNELIERHYATLFTLGYWNQESIDRAQYPAEIQEIVSKIESKDIEISFYSLSMSTSYTVILCQVNGLNSANPFGLLFGSSCTTSLEKSIIKSFKEVIVNIIALYNKNLKSISYSEFIKLENHKPFDHLELYLDLEFAQSYLKNRIFKSNHIEKINLNLFDNKILNHPYDTILHVVQSSHPNCLTPKWGDNNGTYAIHNNNPNFPFILP